MRNLLTFKPMTRKIAAWIRYTVRLIATALVKGGVAKEWAEVKP